MIPKRLSANPLVLSMVKVVPKEVEHSAAPAPNAWRGVISSSLIRTKDSAIGPLIPVRATRAERKRLALRELNDVDSPPAGVSISRVKLNDR